VNVVECEQGSAVWFEARLGKVTASRMGDVIATLKKGGYSAERGKYMDQLVVERLTRQIAQHYVSPAMDWGRAYELEAKAAYEFMRDVTVQLVGFVLHPTIDDSGASPDGLVGEDGAVEFKCPTSTTHLETLLSERIDEKYQAQIQWVLACTERQWCDYVSYDPRMPAHLRTFIKRVHRDDKSIAAMAMQVGIFLGELEERIAAIEKAAADRSGAVGNEIAAVDDEQAARDHLLESVRMTLATRWPGDGESAKAAKAAALEKAFKLRSWGAVQQLSLDALTEGRERLRHALSA
jgi:putative phage-type endonuclease